MKESMLEYKGYHTVVRYNAADGTLRGIIEGINDYVDFQTDCIADVAKEFHCAVDDYLIFCKKIGKNPEKEYKGTFNVRIKPELHKKLALRALENGDTLNHAVEKAIAMYLSDHFIVNTSTTINGTAQQICENAIKESNINDSRNYPKNVIAFKNSANIKEE